MADTIYPSAIKKLFSADLDLENGTWVALLVEGHSYDSADEYISDLAVADEFTGTGYSRETPTNVVLTLDGAVAKLDFDDLFFAGISDGTPSHIAYGLVVGSDTTSPIICISDVTQTFTGITWAVQIHATGLIRGT